MPEFGMVGFQILTELTFKATLTVGYEKTTSKQKARTEK